MKLYLANIAEITPEHWELISPERAEKARRYRFHDDQKRCVAGGLLMRRFLGDTEIFTDEFGKPRAKNGIFFNLSHSGEWVAMAVDSAEVGCDIERLRQADALKLGKVVFTGAELESIRENPDRLGVFYRLWTKKEALLKCMGKGFHRAAKSVEVINGSFCEDGVIYNMKTKAFSDYTISVCAKNSSADFDIEFVHF